MVLGNNDYGHALLINSNTRVKQKNHYQPVIDKNVNGALFTYSSYYTGL